jgi:hypothetical protein
MSFELPAPSASLKNAMQKLVPAQIERRKAEDAEDAEEEEELCHGGFKPWQRVQSVSDISFGHILGVRQGTPGIIVGNSSDDQHLTVKFDRREDDSDLCVDVHCGQVMKPLPNNFRLGQKVMACVDLELNDALVVPLGCTGTIIALAAGAVDRLLVSFAERLDGIHECIAVDADAILPDRLLVGGFKLGQKVLCNGDLSVNGQVHVPRDTAGKVVAEYSDTRLTIHFDAAESNQNQEGYESHRTFNVQPFEIRALRDLPCDIRPGETVHSKFDLGSGPSNVLVLAGTRGVVHEVHTCIDEMRIIVAFRGNEEHGKSPQLLTVSDSSIEKAPLANADEDATLRVAENVSQ